MPATTMRLAGILVPVSPYRLHRPPPRTVRTRAGYNQPPCTHREQRDCVYRARSCGDTGGHVGPMVVNATTPCPAEWPGHGVVGADRARSADDVDGSQGLLSPAKEDHSPGFGGEHLGGGQSLVFRGDLDV